jgi:beta-galactosidase
MARAMGLNTVGVYVFWNYHEEKQGAFDFLTENRNIAEFVKIAAEEGLWVIIRPGPYVCAEWEFGGFPAWLLKDNTGTVRSNSQFFMKSCKMYLNQLGKQLGSLQITRGGPILMLQVENEYGSFGSDKEFMGATRDMIRDAGFDVPLFTADGPSQCKNGYVEGVLPGINGDYNPESVRDTIKKYNNGKGPFFVPEFYPGWLDHWGEQHSVVPVERFADEFETLLKSGISVSLYMFHGGTNFGFMNGANYGGRYQPQPTSYDYDAPLDEAGRPTQKYYALREIIKKYLPRNAKIPDVPEVHPVIELPEITFAASASLFETLPKSVQSVNPLSMEDVDQPYGYILYRTTINSTGNQTLTIKELRDYGIVYLNGIRVGSLDRRHKRNKITIEVRNVPATLDILVENGGRINYGREMVSNRKGVTEKVFLDDQELTHWEMFPLEMKNVTSEKFKDGMHDEKPAFIRGSFTVDKIGDTFLDMRGWEKGCVWVNGHNLGRYWYIGPQQTLYLPGAWLREGENEITVFELEQSSHKTIQGLKEPVLDSLVVDKLQPPAPKRAVASIHLDEGDMVAEGAFVAGDSLQPVTFKPVAGRYVALQSFSSLRNDPFASIAEFYVLDAKGRKLPRDTWKVFSVDSEELLAEDGHAENAFDNDTETIWHTEWGNAKPPHPHYLAIDLGDQYTIGGFTYRSRSGGAPGKIKEYRFYIQKEPFTAK